MSRMIPVLMVGMLALGALHPRVGVAAAVGSKVADSTLTGVLPFATTGTTAGLAANVQNFPRLASLYSYYTAAQAPTFARYGQVVAPLMAGPDGAVRALKAQSPSTRVYLYLDTSAVIAPGFDGMSIYPGWWLTLAGTTLAAPVSATRTTIPVANAGIIAANLSTNPDVLVDGETMHVVSVDTGANTLTVQRGLDSTAAPHAAGARIAAHATNWPGSWMLNITPYCPPDPATGLTWMAYLVQQARKDMATGPWDGVYFDNANASWASLSNGQLDANDDNIADGGDGPSGTGWQQGEIRLLTLTRALLPNALILDNGGSYPGFSNGREMEHFPYYTGGLASSISAYTQLAGPGVAVPATIVNADAGNSAAQDLRTMRFNLGIALLGNGYYAYDYGDENHGQTWWYDEYDDGAGSSLVGAIGADQTAISLAPGTGSKFKVGDVVRVPDAVSIHDDEQMLITGINGDTLTVQRGYNGSRATTHPALSKVFTQAQLTAGQGWLGQPLGPATSVASLGPSLLSNGDFEQDATASAAPWTVGVAAPAVATFSRDARTAASGAASAKIVVSQPSPSAPWNVGLTQANLSLTAGTSYTVTFWAKGSAGQPIQAIVQQQASPWTQRASQIYTLTGSWQQYSMTFTAPLTESGIKLQFNVGQAAGTVWIDDVGFRPGSPNLWRRDFTNGTLLLNATTSPQTVTVGPGYRRIAGTQDPATNDGAPVSTVTLAPQDALLLVKTGN